VRHPKVHKEDVGLAALHGCESGVGVRAGRDDLAVVRLCQELLQASKDDRMVVDQYEPYPRHCDHPDAGCIGETRACRDTERR
jgi:hypothetical protein